MHKAFRRALWTSSAGAKPGASTGVPSSEASTAARSGPVAEDDPSQAWDAASRERDPRRDRRGSLLRDVAPGEHDQRFGLIGLRRGQVTVVLALEDRHLAAQALLAQPSRMKPLLPRTDRDPTRGVLALGAAVLAAIVGIDALLVDTVTLTPWVVIAPLYIATRGRVRETAIIAIAAFLASIPLGAINNTWGSSLHVMHVALVLAGGTLAVITARIRRGLDAERLRTSQLLDRERAERVRQEFASRASQLLEAPQDAMSMLDEVAGLAVPDMADLCIIDLLEPDGTLKGMAVRSANASDAANAHGPA